MNIIYDSRSNIGFYIDILGCSQELVFEEKNCVVQNKLIPRSEFHTTGYRYDFLDA